MTNAFQQIRLNNQNLSISEGRLFVNTSGILFSGEASLNNQPAGVTGMQVTGSAQSMTGLISFNGVGGIILKQIGNNTIQISTTGSILPFIFGNTNLTSGSTNSTFITFPQSFLSTPIVIGNLMNNSGDPIFGYQVSGIVSSGFYINFSEILHTNNYFFQYLATTGLNYVELANSSASNNQITLSSGIINLHPAAIKLPNMSGANSARIDAGNIHWEALFSPTGSGPQSGLWQFLTPGDFNSNPTLNLTTILKNPQTGINTLQYRASIFSVPNTGFINITTKVFSTPNTGTFTLDNNLSGNCPRTISIELINNDNMFPNQTTLLQLDRNINFSGNASGDSAIVGLYILYKKT